MGKRGRKSKFISFNIDDRTLVHFESQDQALHAALPLLVQAILGITSIKRGNSMFELAPDGF